MSNNLRLSVFLVAIFLYFVVFTIFKKGRIPLKYTLVWLIPTTIILLVSVMPGFIEIIMKELGFQTISNLIIGALLVILMFICMSLTIIVSGQKTKITLLIQEVSILKKEMEKAKDE